MAGFLSIACVAFVLAFFIFQPFAAAEIASAPASTADGLSLQRFRPASTKVYLLGHWFRIEYRIRNTGEEPIRDIGAVLGFSNQNLEAVTSAAGERSPRTRGIGTLGPGEERYIFWLIDARRPGYTDISLRVASSVGELEDTLRVRVL